jgi:hypothetical protein
LGRTYLGGPNAPLSIHESIPAAVNLLRSRREKPHSQLLGREGRTVAW